MNTAVSTLRPLDFGELSKLNPFALLNFSSADKNLKDIIPMVKIEYLASKNTPSDFKKGVFSFNLGFQKEEIRMVLLSMKYGRQLWDKYNPNNESIVPLCSSSNGDYSTNGTLFSEDKPQSCSSCKRSQWDGDNPPACQEVYSLLAYDLDDQLPFIIQAKRSSITPLRKLKTALKITAPRFAYPNTAPNACVSMIMRAKPVDNYYVLDFPQRDLKGNHLWTRLPEKQAIELTKLAMELTKTFASIDLHDEAIAANGDNNSSIPF